MSSKQIRSYEQHFVFTKTAGKYTAVLPSNFEKTIKKQKSTKFPQHYYTCDCGIESIKQQTLCNIF